MAISLGEIARQFDCELQGDADVQILRAASLGNADSASISFLSSPAFRAQLATTRAAAVILRAADAGDCPAACLVNENPYAAYARIATVLYPSPPVAAGIHPLSSVDATARVAASAQVSAHVFVGERTTIGENTFVGPGCVIGPDCVVGAGNRLLANVTLVRDVAMGDRCIIHPGAVVGSDGFGNAMTPEGWVKVPQLGRVQIGNDVEIGANCTIDRGALDDTVIDDGVRLDNLVHLAHNVRIGAHTAIAGQCGFAGSAVIGKRCMFAGHSGAVGHVTVCDDVILSAQGMITKDITEPGVYASSFAAEPVRSWNRKVARFRRLDRLIQRVDALEKDRE